ncbi:MAG: hypothetical protein ACYCSX_17035, partial [Acidimicrobiales bacterium]
LLGPYFGAAQKAASHNAISGLGRSASPQQEPQNMFPRIEVRRHSHWALRRLVSEVEKAQLVTRRG